MWDREPETQGSGHEIRREGIKGLLRNDYRSGPYLRFTCMDVGHDAGVHGLCIERWVELIDRERVEIIKLER